MHDNNASDVEQACYVSNSRFAISRYIRVFRNKHAYFPQYIRVVSTIEIPGLGVQKVMKSINTKTNEDIWNLFVYV